MSNGTKLPGIGGGRSYMTWVRQAAATAKGKQRFLKEGGSITLVSGKSLNIPRASGQIPDAALSAWPIFIDTVVSYFENPASLKPQQGPFDWNSPQGRITAMLFFQGINQNVAAVFLNPTLWSSINAAIQYLVRWLFGPEAENMPEAYLVLQNLLQGFRQAGGTIFAPTGMLARTPLGGAPSGFLAGFSGGMTDLFSAVLQMKIFSMSASPTSLLDAVHTLLTRIGNSVEAKKIDNVTVTKGEHGLTVSLKTPPPLRVIIYDDKQAHLVAGTNAVNVGSRAYLRLAEAIAGLVLISDLLDILRKEHSTGLPATTDQATKDEIQLVLNYFDPNRTAWSDDLIWVNDTSFQGALSDLELTPSSTQPTSR